jgi:hypothetical protein
VTFLLSVSGFDREDVTDYRGAGSSRVDDVSSPAVACAASSLLGGVLDGALPLVEVARTRLGVHYETGRADVPVLCVCTPDAVRLPASVVTPVLPTGPVAVRARRLVSGPTTWRVGRWWTPPRPQGLTPPDVVPDLPEGAWPVEEIRPDALLGLGPGLTPAGDDVLAAHATGDLRGPRWRAQTLEALGTRTTTAVSRGLLRHAADGWATPQLADFVTAACRGDAASETRRLLAVGHSSGAALAGGAWHVLATRPPAYRGAA